MSFQVNGDIPPRLKKSAHEIILEFIRSRPPLNPVSICYRHLAGNSHCCQKKRLRSLTATISCGRQVSARKLKPHPPRPQSLHERLLEGIKAERKLRPVSPDLIRRSRLGTCRGANATLAILPETQSYLLRLHFMIPSTSEFKNH